MDDIAKLLKKKDELLIKVYNIDDEIQTQKRLLLELQYKTFVSEIFRYHVRNKYFRSKYVTWTTNRNEIKMVYQWDGVYIMVRKSEDSRYGEQIKQTIVEVDGILVYESR